MDIQKKTLPSRIFDSANKSHTSNYLSLVLKVICVEPVNFHLLFNDLMIKIELMIER